MKRWILAALMSAASLFGGSAFAYDVMVYNCTGERLSVITFDEKDLVRMVSYAEYDIPPLGIAQAQCVGTTGCYIRVFYGGFRGPGESFETGAPLYIQYNSAIGVYRVPSCQHR
jgi:hypothetical protein